MSTRFSRHVRAGVQLSLIGLLALTGCPSDDADGDSETNPAATDSASGTETAGATDSVGASETAAAAALTPEEATPVVENYAALVSANYADAISTAQALQTALLAFTGNPNAGTLQSAKDAWLAAREPYGQTESFRFYDGPIDDADGPEGQLNAWPMDESYVDYVDGMDGAGIINDPSTDITKEMLSSLNEVGGEENVATGYHAIEFLLWGQDLNDSGPGDRSFEDFVDDGPVANPDRRRLYLETVAELLVDDLQAVSAEWDAAGGAYRASFLALPPDEAITNIMRGIGALAGAELAEERMNVAFDTKLQEDEHSCFSDNTHNDVLYNFLAVKNVYLGDYGNVSGPGIDSLVEARDPMLAQEIADKIAETESLIAAIPQPFDQAILGADADPGRVALAAAIESLRDLGELFVMAASTMEIGLNIALE